MSEESKFKVGDVWETRGGHKVEICYVSTANEIRIKHPNLDKSLALWRNTGMRHCEVYGKQEQSEWDLVKNLSEENNPIDTFEAALKSSDQPREYSCKVCKDLKYIPDFTAGGNGWSGGASGGRHWPCGACNFQTVTEVNTDAMVADKTITPQSVGYPIQQEEEYNPGDAVIPSDMGIDSRYEKEKGCPFI